MSARFDPPPRKDWMGSYAVDAVIAATRERAGSEARSQELQRAIAWALLETKDELQMLNGTLRALGDFGAGVWRELRGGGEVVPMPGRGGRGA